MPRRVEQHAHAFLRLELRQACTTFECVRDCPVEVIDLDVEVEHLVLSIRLLGPHGFAVTGLGLERQPGSSGGITHQHPLWFAKRDFPPKESPIEIGHRVRVGAVDANGL
jgi:hypothetical protein